VRDAGAWLAAVEAGRLPTAEEDRIDPVADRNERLMLSLRTVEGAPLSGLTPAQARQAADLLRHRLGVARGGRLVLTSRGMELHSLVAERLFQ
jgi:oxygen-independent coproporphyrinogen-3 oxidase